MGYAIASAAREAGANVTLISGPSHLTPPDDVTFVAVESAAEMQHAVFTTINNCHIYISTAAVSDYRVKNVAPQKIKKTEDTLTLELSRNDDILAAVACYKNRPYVVGFAAETENLIDNAKQKLQRKNLNMIVANNVAETKNGEKDIGFNSDYNALHVFWKHNEQANEQHFDIARKSQLAKQLIALIAKEYKTNRNQHAKNTA